jgi:hypothetical protein
VSSSGLAAPKRADCSRNAVRFASGGAKPAIQACVVVNLSTKDELLQDLAHEEARLADLDRQCEAARSRVEVLRTDLAALRAAEPPRSVLPVVTSVQAPTTPAEKVRLFRTLFKGRQDIFSTRFVSKKTGKPGYAPACANKFVRGVCELPKIKCGECPNQAFMPLEDQVVLDHLRGRHVIGVYPLLEDETCWFLAVDFDRSSWQDDVGAFIETFLAIGVPAAVERSRSGKGAHA